MELTDYRNRKFYQCNMPALLKRAGMTQVALANIVGMSPKSFHRIAHGRNIPYAETAGKIAAALKTSRQDIWPDYDEIMAARREQVLSYAEAGRQAQKAQRKSKRGPHETGLFKKPKSAYSATWNYRQRNEQVEHIGPALPVTAEDRERDLILRARKVPADLIEDDAWCRRIAVVVHQWILNNSVWGVYRHLRAIMAAEQMAANERAERAAAVGGGQ